MLYFWILFNIFALGMLVVDLRFLHRPGRATGFKRALGLTLMYVALAAVFATGLYFWEGRQIGLEFITGYVLELSLSVDNLFIFLVIFKYFAVPEEQQHRVLFWGIIGALILRGIFIGVGVGLIQRFHWVLLVFGAFLIYSGLRLMIAGEHKIDPERNPLIRALRGWIPITAEYQGGRFLIRKEDARLYATPLLVTLLVIEIADVLFAADSIPAVLSVTLNAFIVYTSNVFAILGLRSLFFVVSGLMKGFRFLHHGLALILILVGAKMLAADRVRVPTAATLGAVAGILLVSVVASALYPSSAKGS
ncbi:MAG TPA: TerC family protein [Candidatus Sulfotelmatobacter sp.]|nr:TerC family protein [Candidatus Sulfotelmatobacter sp.]